MIREKIAVAAQAVDATKKADAQINKMNKELARECGSPGLARWVYTAFWSECSSLEQKRTSQEKVLTNEKAKAFVAFDAAIDLTIAAYDLTPERFKSDSKSSSDPSDWNPHFSVEEKKGADGRWTISPLNKMSYGSTRKSDIKIFPRPFLEKLTHEQRKTMIDGGPDRLALTILHETHHWAYRVHAKDAYGSFDVDKPSSRRFMEARSYKAQADFLKLMNEDEYKQTGRTLFSQDQIQYFEEKSAQEEKFGIEIRDELGDPPMEHQLPPRLRRSDTLHENPESRESDPNFHPIEILKISGQERFVLSMTNETAELVSRIQERNEEGRKRRQLEREKKRLQTEQRLAENTKQEQLQEDVKRILTWLTAACEKRKPHEISATFNRVIKNYPDFRSDLRGEGYRSFNRESSSFGCALRLIDALPDYPNANGIIVNSAWAQKIWTEKAQKRKAVNDSIRDSVASDRRKKSQEQLNRMLSEERAKNRRQNKPAPRKRPAPVQQVPYSEPELEPTPKREKPKINDCWPDNCTHWN
ncbi:MAG: hypothetical protein COB53_06500 [Elusimicrobia bacterium]|nr:MAG: hypothetical protein COB53_06500 [Elusimicrobiota bacterium]